MVGGAHSLSYGRLYSRVTYCKNIHSRYLVGTVMRSLSLEFYMALPALAVTGARAAVSAAPSVMSFIKEQAPAVANKAQALFTKSGGGSLIAAANEAHVNGDVTLARSIYETLLKSGARYDLLVKSNAMLSVAELKAFMAGMAEVEQLEIAAAEAHKVTNGNIRDTARRKAVEIRRVCQLLGVSSDELIELLVSLATLTPSDVRDYQEDRLALGMGRI